MFTRISGVLLVLLCVVAFVGCEGETGPAGPSGATGPPGPPGPVTLLAYADIDEDGTVLSSGPSGVTVSVVNTGAGVYEVTVSGTFPSTPGVLLTTTSSSFSPFVDCISAGHNMTWGAAQITFDVTVYCTAITALLNGEFSFAIMGD